MEKLTLTKAEFYLLNGARSDDPIREALTGINITETQLQASNGAVLVTVEKIKGRDYPAPGNYAVVSVPKMGKSPIQDLILDREPMAGLQFPDISIYDPKQFNHLVYEDRTQAADGVSRGGVVLRMLYATGRAIDSELLDGFFRACKDLHGQKFLVYRRASSDQFIREADECDPIRISVPDMEASILLMPFTLWPQDLERPALAWDAAKEETARREAAKLSPVPAV